MTTHWCHNDTHYKEQHMTTPTTDIAVNLTTHQAARLQKAIEDDTLDPTSRAAVYTEIYRDAVGRGVQVRVDEDHVPNLEATPTGWVVDVPVGDGYQGVDEIEWSSSVDALSTAVINFVGALGDAAAAFCLALDAAGTAIIDVASAIRQGQDEDELAPDSE